MDQAFRAKAYLTWSASSTRPSERDSSATGLGYGWRAGAPHARPAPGTRGLFHRLCEKALQSVEARRLRSKTSKSPRHPGTEVAFVLSGWD